MKNILVIGATSSIAHETMKIFAQDGASFYLVARSENRLHIVSDDLKSRGANNVLTCIHDVTQFDQHESIIENAFNLMPDINTVLIAHGTLPNQDECLTSYEKILQEIEINFLSIVSYLHFISQKLIVHKYGTIAVISSVAGDRGRKSNFIYGSAKSALTEYLNGLRGYLYSQGIHILTIKPGITDTPMTQKTPKGLLMASAQKVGKDIYHAIQTQKNTIYTPWYWRYLMWIIQLIPEFIFKKMSI